MTRHRMIRVGLILGVAGLLLCAVGLVVNPGRAFLSYLTAYAFAATLPVGALLVLMVGIITSAEWLPEFRPLLSRIASIVPVIAVLFLPLLFGLGELYPWVPPLDALRPEVRESVLDKRSYLNVPFFIARSVIYLGVWTALALLLRRESASQRLVSAIGLIVLTLTVTFASFDWFMSLQPAWYSTIYGFYYLSGAFVAALAFVIGLAFALDRSSADTRREAVPVDHYHGVGKLLLTAVLAWAYIGFSQLLVIWMGDLPREVTWYIPRFRTSWNLLGMALIFGHFLLPSLLLLSREVKRRPAWLAGTAVLLVAMHFVDVYWLIVPALRADGFAPHWLDIAALAVVIGLGAAYCAWRWREKTSPREMSAVTPREMD